MDDAFTSLPGAGAASNDRPHSCLRCRSRSAPLVEGQLSLQPTCVVFQFVKLKSWAGIGRASAGKRSRRWPGPATAPHAGGRFSVFFSKASCCCCCSSSCSSSSSSSFLACLEMLLQQGVRDCRSPDVRQWPQRNDLQGTAWRHRGNGETCNKIQRPLHRSPTVVIGSRCPAAGSATSLP